MQEIQLAELRRWAAALAEDGRAETSAAGRAILLLIEEVERLQAQLAADAAVAVGETAETGEPLRNRLGRFARQR